MVADALVLRSYVRTGRGIRWRLTEPQVLFIGLFAIYFAAACYLDLVANVIPQDALSHLENAERVLFSRDPHLAAIGFVWSPLPTLVLLPLVPLKFLWPQLTTVGLAGGIVSAVCMAAAVVQVRGMFMEMGLRRHVVLLLTIAFAFHPLIFLFAANGMTEAMQLMLLLMAVRYLARWLRDSGLNSLITTGIALSLAYFTRYEALAAALGVMTVVAVTSLLRTRKQGGSFWSVLCDVAIVAAPVTLAFLVWAFASWLITGHPFEQFASTYSNSAQLQAEGAKHPWSPSLIGLVASQLGSLEPLAPLVAVLFVVAYRRTTTLAVAAFACLGSTFAFMALAELNGSIDNQLRYLIVFVPLSVTLAGASVAGATRPRDRIRRTRFVRLRLETTIALASVLCTTLALPVSARAILDPHVSSDLAIGLQSIVSPSAYSDRGGHLNWVAERRAAADLDQLNLPPGSVLLDDFLGFSIVLASSNPHQFVITSDRDFQVILADPTGTGVRYILVPQPINVGSLDALNRQYPTLYENGGGFATLVRQYVSQGVNDSNWRLYRIN